MRRESSRQLVITLIGTLVALTATSLVAGTANPRAPQPETASCPSSVRKHGACHAAGYDFESVVFNAKEEESDLPLVLALHWSSSTPKELLKVLGAQTGRFRVVLPYGRHPKRNGFSFFVPSFYDRPLPEQREGVKEEAARLADFVREIQRLYQCPGPILVTGASQGGDLSFQLAHDHPDLMAASFPMLGRNMVGDSVRWRDAPPVTAYFSLTDPIVGPDLAKASINAIQGSAGNGKIREFAADGHDISEEMATALANDLHAHLAQACRQPRPERSH